MADVKPDTTNPSVLLRVSDIEWRLIMKSLAYYVGLNVPRKQEDRIAAAALNKALLIQRVDMLKNALKVAEAALSHTEDQPNEAPVEPGVEELA